MNRRSFNRLATLGGVSVVASCSKMQDEVQRVATTPLHQGDHVGLIAPGFRISQKHLDCAKRNMAALGLTYDVHPDILQQNGYLSGSDKFRRDEIMRMYSDPSIDAVWCINGGYGTTRLLDDLDYDLILANAKPLIGFSDITALMSAVYKHTGSPCFHGPMPAYEWSAYTKKNVSPVFSKDLPYHISYSPVTEEHRDDDAYIFEVIHEGEAQGPLVGGNLSLIVSLLGTPHLLNLKDKIVFLEDIDESPYRIDRMLTQLISAGFFHNTNGVIFGIFDDCDPNYPNSQTVREVIRERMENFKIPIMYGFSFGHVTDKCTLPIGSMAKMSTADRLITLLESPYTQCS